MKLTTFSDYSLRVLVYLAAHPGRRATIAEIARAFEISESHLNKVVHCLGQNAWLASVRGRGGGLELAQPPDRIRIGTVVRQTERADVPAECFDRASDRCIISDACRLRGVLAEGVAAFYGVLDRYTVADLVQNRATLSRLLLAG